MFLGLSLFITSCSSETPEEKNAISKSAEEYSADVPLAWHKLFLEIDRYSPGYRPPAAARMLAYTNLAAYEATIPGMENNNTMQSVLTGMVVPRSETTQEYHWPTCVNTAYATIFTLFYPHVEPIYLARIANLEAKHDEDARRAGVNAEVLLRSKEYGKRVAESVYNYSTSDVAGHDAFRNPHPTTYTPPVTGPNGEVLWQPSLPDFTRALFPNWGRVRTFAINESDKIGRAPLPWSEDPNSLFYNQAKEVELWVNRSTYEDRWIAEFWSDDIFELTFEPAARLISLANQLLEEDKLSLGKAVEMYAKLSMALSDTGVAVWNSKYLYNVERPITYIRRVMNPNWLTNLNDPISGAKGLTPPFPAYPSGHSGFGGTGSAILADVFGNSRTFIDKSHINRTEFLGLPRSYNNILELGVENAYSRMPLGVHFRMDCDEGLRLGYLAARKVIEMPWRK